MCELVNFFLSENLSLKIDLSSYQNCFYFLVKFIILNLETKPNTYFLYFKGLWTRWCFNMNSNFCALHNISPTFPKTVCNCDLLIWQKYIIKPIFLKRRFLRWHVKSNGQKKNKRINALINCIPFLNGNHEYKCLLRHSMYNDYILYLMNEWSYILYHDIILKVLSIKDTPRFSKFWLWSI